MLKVAGLLCMAAVVSMKTCTITFGNPPPPGVVTNFSLGVPWYQQQGPQYCGAASVQMWAGFDRLFFTQSGIATTMGLDPAHGVDRGAIQLGVNRFTSSGSTAQLAYACCTGDFRAIFDSGEITSMNSRVPVLSIVNGGLHAGVVDGGEWHLNDDGTLYVWDTVFFHDPEIRPDITFLASDWDNYTESHIITPSALAAAQSNYSQYGGVVVERGSARDRNPPPV